MAIRLDEIKEPIRLDSISVGPQRLDELNEKAGIVETLFLKPEYSIPFGGFTAKAIDKAKYILATKRLQKERYEPEFLQKIDPFRMVDYEKIPDVLKYIIPKPKTEEELRQQDIKLVEDYTEYLEELDRERTLGGQVAGILKDIPSYMFEFWATGGLATLGEESAKKAGRKLLGKYANTLTGKAALATGGSSVGAALRSAGMPHRASESILRRQVPRNISIDQDGNVDVTGPIEKPFTSIWKGLADHYIEIMSEQSGEMIAPAFGELAKRYPFMGELTSKLKPRWLKLHPNKNAADFTRKIASKAGFHGILVEVGEEYLGDFTRAITDVEHFGAGEDAGIFERISAGAKQDIQNTPAMLIAFAVPGLAGQAIERIDVRKIENQKILDEINIIKGIEYNTPTQVETAEGMIGYEGEFDIEKYEKEIPDYDFRKPGLWTKIGLTPKWVLNRILGVETLLKDVEAAELSRQVEQQDLNAWTNKVIKQIKKQKYLKQIPEILDEEAGKESVKRGIPAKKTLAGKLKRKIVDKNPIHILRDILDTYEEAPDFLNEESESIFNQVRELTRYMRDRANVVRKELGLPAIDYTEGYITHWMNAIAKQIVEKDMPVHYGYFYHLMGDLPKTVKNPTQERRTVRGKLEKHFSKDLGKLLHVMINYDLKDIYITKPYMAATEELQKLRKDKIIPKSTAKEVEDYLEYDIRKFKHPWDVAFNETFKKPVDLINKILAPLKLSIDDPSRNLFGGLRRLAHISGLGFRIRPLTRNLGQRLLLLDFYRMADYAKAQAVAFGLAEMPEVEHPITGEKIPLIELIREQDWYKAALRKFEDVDTAIRGMESVAMTPYSRTHIGSLFLSNVEVSAITGYFDWQHRFQQAKNKKFFDFAIKQSKRMKVPVVDLLTKESDMLWSVREAIRRTQWEYMSISMPSFYRSEFKRGMGVFQSWWMNYFFNHCRECINQISTGRNSQGRLLTPYGRLRAVKGMGTIIGIGKMSKALFGIEMLKYLFVPLPSYLPPVPELIAGVIQYLAADDEKERKRAAKRVKYGLKFWIPFSAFMRDANRLLSGEYDIWDFLFYRPKEKG